MPLALDPEQKIVISLQLDQNKSEEVRPSFIVRFLSGRDRRKISENINEALKSKSDDDSEKLIFDAVKIGLVGWKNIVNRAGEVIPFDINLLPEILTDLEMWELIGLMLKKTRLSEIDLKNLESPSDVDTTAYAKDVKE